MECSHNQRGVAMFVQWLNGGGGGEGVGRVEESTSSHSVLSHFGLIMSR